MERLIVSNCRISSHKMRRPLLQGQHHKEMQTSSYSTQPNNILKKAIIIPQSFRNSKWPPEVVPAAHLRKESKSESA